MVLCSDRVCNGGARGGPLAHRLGTRVPVNDARSVSRPPGHPGAGVTRSLPPHRSCEQPAECMSASPALRGSAPLRARPSDGYTPAPPPPHHTPPRSASLPPRPQGYLPWPVGPPPPLPLPLHPSPMPPPTHRVSEPIDTRPLPGPGPPPPPRGEPGRWLGRILSPGQPPGIA